MIYHFAVTGGGESVEMCLSNRVKRAGERNQGVRRTAFQGSSQRSCGNNSAGRRTSRVGGACCRVRKIGRWLVA